LIGWGRYHMDWSGQMLVLFIIAVAACEAAVALVLVLMLYRQNGSLDLTAWQDTREEGTLPYVDKQIPEEEAGEPVWPALTPAGREPQRDPRRELYRPRV
jgi:NADH-quinone oxidoreductase subunit K